MHKKFILTALCLLLSACEPAPQNEEIRLKITSFEKLPAWSVDNLNGIASAYQKSCARILKMPSGRDFGPLKEAGQYKDWQPICAEFMALTANAYTAQDVREFFESRFTPYEVSAGDETKGLFTGYYEAHLRGSFKREGAYQTPLYQRPDDLVMVNLGAFRDGLKGQRIAGRVVNGQLKPYENRADIVDGQWPHNDKTLIWVDSPVDAFFVQIQGSGVVQLPDGKIARIGYAGQNGHPYYAIGRELIKRGALTKENVSMQSIRDWLETNPDQATEIMNTNRSYVFFRLLDEEGPLGGEGVALTAGRSLAVDRTIIPYGTPLWLSTQASSDNEISLQKMMIAQDTGGAIRGAVRGDVFWGYGEDAEHKAGHMKSTGRYWIFLPKTLYQDYDKD